jgi:hypothetical protein
MYRLCYVSPIKIKTHEHIYNAVSQDWGLLSARNKNGNFNISNKITQ